MHEPKLNNLCFYFFYKIQLSRGNRSKGEVNERKSAFLEPSLLEYLRGIILSLFWLAKLTATFFKFTYLHPILKLDNWVFVKLAPYFEDHLESVYLNGTDL